MIEKIWNERDVEEAREIFRSMNLQGILNLIDWLEIYWRSGIQLSGIGFICEDGEFKTKYPGQDDDEDEGKYGLSIGSMEKNITPIEALISIAQMIAEGKNPKEFVSALEEAALAYHKNQLERTRGLTGLVGHA